VPLIKNVGSLEITYFDPNANTWLPRWPGGNRMPSLVKVSVGRPDAADPWEGSHPAEADTILASNLMRRVSPSCKRDSGAALLLALWALFLLAGVVFAWALNINSRLTVSATANRVLSAEAMASSGAEVALNPTIKPASANLHKENGQRKLRR
jgi:hypothetical protein